jgi:TatD DNase family protein
MELIDSHCHLERADYPQAGELIARARAAGIVHAVVIGQFHRPGSFGDAVSVAAEHPDFLSPTLGIHPHDAARATPADWDELAATCARPEVLAVGEAGLDYYYDKSPRDVQKELFARQCALARSLGKPLVVHVRDAHEDCHEILKREGITRGVIHCFTGDTDAARRYLDLGFFISLSGVITYKKTEALADAVRFAPLERLMVETDSPFLAPVPHRGKKNEPAHVVQTAMKLAELKGVEVEVVARETTSNAVALFGLRIVR